VTLRMFSVYIFLDFDHTAYKNLEKRAVVINDSKLKPTLFWIDSDFLENFGNIHKKEKVFVERANSQPLLFWIDSDFL